MKNNKLTRATLSGLFLLSTALIFSSNCAFAGKTFDLGQDKSFTIGAGLRTSFGFQEDGAASGNDAAKNFDLESIRLYTSGQVYKGLFFEFNTEIDSNGDINILDGIAKMEISDPFNMWLGRMLPPSDRATLSGPYYQNMWDYPIVSRYPSVIAGRDEGLAVWGQVLDAKLKYQAGLYEGVDNKTTFPNLPNGNPNGVNPKDSPLLAARITYNILDGESGYYNSSTYYGKKDIIALGFVMQSQSDHVLNNGQLGDFLGLNVDFLLEKSFGNGGVMDIEAALYIYDYDNVNPDALGLMVVGSYLIPGKLGGYGQLQPKARLQVLDVDNMTGFANYGAKVLDLQLDYVMDGHDARSSIILSQTNPEVGNSYLSLKFGIQLQI